MRQLISESRKRYQVDLDLPVDRGSEIGEMLVQEQRLQLLAAAFEGRWDIYEVHYDVIGVPFDVSLSEIWHSPRRVTLQVDVEEILD